MPEQGRDQDRAKRRRGAKRNLERRGGPGEDYGKILYVGRLDGPTARRMVLGDGGRFGKA